MAMHHDDGRYDHVIRAVQESPWALLPEKLDAIVEVLQLRAAGGRFTPAEIRARIGARRDDPPAPAMSGDIAVLPLQGILSHRMNMFTDVSGGTSTEKFTQLFQRALNAPEVGVVVLDVDSPGGNVFGVQELADVLYRNRGGKPVVAVANSMAASAAYWLATQADEFVVTPSGQVGSIGVVRIHEDLTGAAEKAGVKVTHITAGKFKAEGHAFAPLSDEARDAMQHMVDGYYTAFVQAVARGRSVKPEAVRSGFGQGRIVGAADALQAGMVDRVATLQDTIDRLKKPGALVELRQTARLRAMDPAAALARRRARFQALATAPRVAPAPPDRAAPAPASTPEPAAPPTYLHGWGR
jgi:signal peptide peptidase SppA